MRGVLLLKLKARHLHLKDEDATIKKFAPTAAAAGLLSTAAIGRVAALDTDDDGVLSYLELQAGYPGLDAAKIDQLDTNGDGVVDAEELRRRATPTS